MILNIAWRQLDAWSLKVHLEQVLTSLIYKNEKINNSHALNWLHKESSESSRNEITGYKNQKTGYVLRIIENYHLTLTTKKRHFWIVTKKLGVEAKELPNS